MPEPAVLTSAQASEPRRQGLAQVGLEGSGFRTLADLSHPNLVTLYELVADDEACFFTVEVLCSAIASVRVAMSS